MTVYLRVDIESKLENNSAIQKILGVTDNEIKVVEETISTEYQANQTKPFEVNRTLE